MAVIIVIVDVNVVFYCLYGPSYSASVVDTEQLSAASREEGGG